MACVPGQSKGGCVPVYVDPAGDVCPQEQGGTKTVGIPIFVAITQNETDLIWRDEDFTVIQADDDGTPFLFDNT